jgi:hypothetical protein
MTCEAKEQRRVGERLAFRLMNCWPHSKGLLASPFAQPVSGLVFREATIYGVRL